MHFIQWKSCWSTLYINVSNNKKKTCIEHISVFFDYNYYEDLDQMSVLLTTQRLASYKQEKQYRAELQSMVVRTSYFANIFSYHNP